MVYKVRIEQDENGYFAAEVPGMPGCFSQGNTLDEAKENIKEAIEGWIEVINKKTEESKDGEIYEVIL